MASRLAVIQAQTSVWSTPPYFYLEVEERKCRGALWRLLFGAPAVRRELYVWTASVGWRRSGSDGSRLSLGKEAVLDKARAVVEEKGLSDTGPIDPERQGLTFTLR